MDKSLNINARQCRLKNHRVTRLIERNVEIVRLFGTTHRLFNCLMAQNPIYAILDMNFAAPPSDSQNS